MLKNISIVVWSLKSKYSNVYILAYKLYSGSDNDRFFGVFSSESFFKYSLEYPPTYLMIDYWI